MQRSDERRGQVLVEFAVALPLLVGLLFFLVESGFYLSARQGIHTALREGAVLAATRSVDGILAPAERPAIVEAMCLAFRRPGVDDPTALVDVERRNNGCTVVLSVEAHYHGVTPLQGVFDTRPLAGRLVLPLRRPDGGAP